MPVVRPYRLTEIDPQTLAFEEVDLLVHETMTRLKELGVAGELSIEPVRSPVYKKLLQTAQYAMTGKPRLRDVGGLVKKLADVFHIDQARLERGEPVAALEVVLQGALARNALEHGEDLSALQLALLSGLDRDHVLALARSIPGGYRSKLSRHRPWRFTVNDELLEWLRERERSVA